MDQFFDQDAPLNADLMEKLEQYLRDISGGDQDQEEDFGEFDFPPLNFYSYFLFP